MGTVEETGKVATSVIESLKTQPLALGLIVLNVCFLLFVGYIAHLVSSKNAADALRQQSLIEQLTQACIEKRSELPTGETHAKQVTSPSTPNGDGSAQP